MAKKKKQIIAGKGFGDSTQKLNSGLAKLEAHMQRQQWAQAFEILQSLEKIYPNNTDVLTGYVNLYYEVKDFQRYQYAAERLLEINSGNADATLGLAGAYMENIRPMLALRTFRQFLDRFSNHPRAAEVRKTVAELEANLEQILADMNLTGEDGVEIATWHEQAQSFLEEGKYLECRLLEERVLARRPNFISALNNISQTYCLEGNLEEAIACCRRVLDSNPNNYHALSNLTRYLCISGKLDEAKQEAEKLKAIASDSVDIWVKKAEAFSFLGDDRAVLDAFAAAEAAGHLEGKLANPLLYHLAAVADLRQGKQEQARQHWQQALKLNPTFIVAWENLEDLDKPVSQRHAPWAFHLKTWVTQKAFIDLMELLPPSQQQNKQAETEAVIAFLQKHREIATLIPVLLERGDRSGREFAFRLATTAQTPEMLEALRDFALSQRGPDDMRQEAAEIVSNAGLLPEAAVRLWVRGKWQELALMNFRINYEPTGEHSEQVEEWLAEALELLRKGDGVKGEELLKRALEVEPDAPDLLFNLAAAYRIQGREQESKALIRDIHQRHPDYVFAHISVALQQVHQDNLDKAEALLKPLLSRREFHIQEFSFFCNAQAELWLKRGNFDSVRIWVDMWENADPQNPAIARWRKVLSQPLPRQ